MYVLAIFTGGRKVALKPNSWFKYSDKVAEIIAVLSDCGVEGSVPKAWKWLSKPLHSAEGLPRLDVAPIHLMDNVADLDIILKHARAYAAYKKSN